MKARKPLTILLCCLGSLLAHAQFSVKGTVKDAETNAAIENASVYLNETSIGITTNIYGQFQLTNIPAGKFQLVVSSVGYDHYKVSLILKSDSSGLQILLKKRREQLDSVTVLPYLTDGWASGGITS